MNPRSVLLVALVTALLIFFWYPTEHNKAIDEDVPVAEQPPVHKPAGTTRSNGYLPGEADWLNEGIAESSTSEQPAEDFADIPVFDAETYSSPHEYALVVQVNQVLAQLHNRASPRDARIALSKLRMLLRDTSLAEDLREEILTALGETTGDPHLRIAELAATILEEEATRVEAAAYGGSRRTASAEPPLDTWAAETEAKSREARRVEELRQTLIYHPNPGQRRRALDELSLSRDPAVLDAVAMALQDPDARNRYAAVQKLGALPMTADGQIRLLLQQALNDLDERVAALARTELLALETSP